MKKRTDRESKGDEEGNEMNISFVVYNSLVGIIWVGISVFGVGVTLSDSTVKLGGLVIFSLATAAILWLLYDTIHQNNKLQGKRSSLGMSLAVIGVITEVVIVMTYSINQVQGVKEPIDNQLNWVIGGGILIAVGVVFELLLIDVALMYLVRGLISNVKNFAQRMVKWFNDHIYIILRTLFTIGGIFLIGGAVFSIPYEKDLERLLMAMVGVSLIIFWNWKFFKRIIVSFTLWTQKKWRGIVTTILLIFAVIVWFLPYDIQVRGLGSLTSLALAITLNWKKVKLALIEIGKGIENLAKGIYSLGETLVQNSGPILRAVGDSIGVILIVLSVFTSDPYLRMWYFLAGMGLLLLAHIPTVSLAFRHNKTLVSDITGISVLYISLTSLRIIEPEWLAYSGYTLGIVLLIMGHTGFFEEIVRKIIHALYSSVKTVTELIQTTIFALLGLLFFVFAASVIINKPLFGLDLSEYDTVARTILGLALAFIGGFSIKFAESRYYVEKGGKRR